jgi:predicted hotdog family 3-hydroxylacyl-ACP dehydratase
MQAPQVPHAAPMRFVTGVSVADAVTTALATVSADSPAVAGGWVRSGYLIEVAAQAIAAGEAIRTGNAVGVERAEEGMLVAVRDWQVFAAVRAHSELVVQIERQAELGPALRCQASIRTEGVLVATGSLQVMRGTP